MRDQLLRVVFWGLLLAATGCFVLGWLVCLVSAGDRTVYLRLANVRVQDGDSIEADIELPYGFTWRRQIRLDGFDAWETSRVRRTVGEITDEELAAGRRAKQALAALVFFSPGVYIRAEPQPRWTYARLLGRVYVEDRDELVDVGDWMRARGHARPTDPVLEAIERRRARPP